MLVHLKAEAEEKGIIAVGYLKPRHSHVTIAFFLSSTPTLELPG